MGYNTGLIILNDAIDVLATDPDAGAKIREGIMLASSSGQVETVPIGNHANPVQILPPQHADATQVIALGGNYIRSLANPYLPATSTPEAERFEVLKHLAYMLGYRLVPLLGEPA